MTYATVSVWMPVLAVFLSGAVAGVFVMLVIGIRRGDRAHRLADEPDTHLDALTRSVLGVGVRTGCPSGNSGAEGE
jgi:hypothetical protein